MKSLTTLLTVAVVIFSTNVVRAVDDASPLGKKADYLLQNLLDKHWLDGLYISIVPSAPHGTKLPHTVDEPGNVIHAGVWTGRYLGGVGYEYAVTKDPSVRTRGGEILKALRILQEVTGKPGLLARGYVKGHGPVMDWERDGADSIEWHQGQGEYADYRWYGDVSVDNFNAVLYGYAIYFDLAADEEQKKFIAHDTDRMMTHLLENHCRIIDVDGEPTMWGHVGIDPDPARDPYYQKLYERRMKFFGVNSVAESPLRASLMLLPDLLIAHRITGNSRYLDFYHKVVARYQKNPEPAFFRQPFSLQKLARTDHSSEGQSYEALYNLIRYEKNPELLGIYRGWLMNLWESNWMEGNSLFTYMTLALMSEKSQDGNLDVKRLSDVPHAGEALADANASLMLYPVDRTMRPVMNSIRRDVELNPHQDPEERRPQAAKPFPMNERPLDNEYAWKGNPYRLDGWLKPTLVAMQFGCDDPQVAWFCDSAGRAYFTRDHGQTWKNISNGMMGASVTGLSASRTRTFVIWARTNRGVLISRDGGLSWRDAGEKDLPEFSESKFHEWTPIANGAQLRVTEAGELVRSVDGGKTSAPAMEGWSIPRATSVLQTPWGIIASGPGGAYRSDDGHQWEEISLWREQETGPADYLHAYWMGRYYGFIAADGEQPKVSLTAPVDAKGATISMNPALRNRCIETLRGGLKSDLFWPSMHAAEALTVAGYAKEVRDALGPRVATTTDERERCGIARELVRAGDRSHVGTLLEVLGQANDYGHVHAAESLFKIVHIGDGSLMRKRVATSDKAPLRLMAAAALVRCGSPSAITVVREYLAGGDPEAKRIAAWLISQIGDSSDASQLEANIGNEQDPVKRAYAENALALLGKEAHRGLLTANLANRSDEIRGLAAVAAIDGRRIDLAGNLEKMLDDPILDVRLRAAQALLTLSQPANRIEAVKVDVYAATTANPRYSEGSMIVLSDGSLLYATTEFIGSESDFAKARIIARTSRDGGRIWSEPRVLQENVGQKNVMSVTLRRLPAGKPGEPRIGMFYLIKNEFNDLKVALRVSNDEAATFGEPTIVTTEPGYHVLNNDRVTVLSSGRILVPVASTADVEKENHFLCRCWYSDDGGASWHQGQGTVDQPKRGAMEPEVIELKDGRVLMIIRTQLGYIAASESKDGGETWNEPKSWGVRSPESPATVRRIPATGDLLLVWNDTYDAAAGHGGKRTPLTAAVSSDEGKTWSHIKPIETDKNHTYAYTSLIFDQGRALLSYYVADEKTGRISSRFRSIPIREFYGANPLTH
ncbi:MAG: exo-alpha-sialidase [Planctomycetaceae bacterium]